ncbi:MAG: efflux transporter periplasmic adaptor subunit [Rhodobacteraceae bacterium]|nr:efflux transporter periplasmic adaptor subunit [Paracoccaceae bacterium]
MRLPRRSLRASIRAALAVLALAPALNPARAEDMLFEGRIEAATRAAVASGRDGKVVEILFRGGEAVEAGDPLLRLDDAFQALDLRIATTEAAAAQARARLADAEAKRMEELGRRDVASAARIDAAAESAARLRVERSTLRAPISGRIGRPLVELGAFVEASVGPPLAEIVALDPVIVAYEVPYDERLAMLAEAGEDDMEAIYARITLTVRASGGALVAGPARPAYAEAAVDPDTGMLTVRASISNPRELFRPGMRVQVTSSLDPEPVR